MANLLQKLGLVAGLAGVVGVASGYESRLENTWPQYSGVCKPGGSLVETRTDYFRTTRIFDVPVHATPLYTIRETFACDGWVPLGRRIIYADGTERLLEKPTKPGDPL